MDYPVDVLWFLLFKHVLGFKTLEICGSYMWAVPKGRKGENNEWRNGKGGTSPVVVVKRAALLFARAPKKESKRALQVQLAVCPPSTNIQQMYNQPSTHSAVSLFPLDIPSVCGGKVLSNSSSRTLMVTPPWLPNSINLIFMKRNVEVRFKLIWSL